MTLDDDGLYYGGICLITDRNACPLTCVEMTQLALRSGLRWIQYRDKERQRINVYRTALKLRQITEAYGACLIINDHPDIAAAVDADGVHLGQDDLPIKEARKIMKKGAIIGISTHSLEEAIEAERMGADYIGFGPVYDTSTKDAGTPKGAQMLKAIRAKVKIPVVAIGGITDSRMPEVMGAGAHAVAVASALLKGSIEDKARSFKSCLN